MRQYRSRLSEVEEKKSIKSAVIFGGGTILIIIAVIVFGLPLFSKFSGLFIKNSNTVTVDNSTILPPNINILPQYTNQQSIIVNGSATPNSEVKVYFNNSSDKTTTDDTGNFAMNIGLSKGINTIYATTLNKNGKESNNSTSYTVNFTTQIPNLTIDSPQNNQNFYGSSQQSLTIQGSTDAGNTVTINDHVAILDNNSKFNFPFNLQNGDNSLKIISADYAGNKKEIDLKVIFNP
ncbi:hypothetical protein BH10PAT1_BH10PAT1_6760 [soil metagenome]